MFFQFGKSRVEPEMVPAAPAAGTEMEDVVGRVAHQASGLGKESATLNGLIDDLAVTSSRQAETFNALAAEIDAMIRAN
ncbi:hypothetical protein GCM10027343_04490 [Noviherbaspirillum agri]